MEILYDFDIVIMSVILLCVLSQSIFGVGVLLWGTPALLVMGFGYAEVLSLLLPVSIGLSITQVVEHWRLIDLKVFLKFLTLCLPSLLAGLFLVLFFQLDATPFVIIALLIGGTLRISSMAKFRNKLQRNSDLLLPVIGIVHGVSNLGGSILVLWASSFENGKRQTRTTVALVYTFLAATQLMTLRFALSDVSINIVYVLAAFPIHFISSRFLFRYIKEDQYQILLTCLIFSISTLLSLKYLQMI
jgi:hypothetical protein